MRTIDNKGNNRILPIQFHCALYLWFMPEMVAPRALVFRPLVKGNEDPENEIASLYGRLKWMLYTVLS